VGVEDVKRDLYAKKSNGRGRFGEDVEKTSWGISQQPVGGFG
jgi:hypothetical protein